MGHRCFMPRCISGPGKRVKLGRPALSGAGPAQNATRDHHSPLSPHAATFEVTREFRRADEALTKMVLKVGMCVVMCQVRCDVGCMVLCRAGSAVGRPV